MYLPLPQLGYLNSNVTSSSELSAAALWEIVPRVHHFPSHHLVCFLSWHFAFIGYFLVLCKGQDRLRHHPHGTWNDCNPDDPGSQLPSPTRRLTAATSWSKKGHQHDESPTRPTLKRMEAAVGEEPDCHVYLLPFQGNVTNKQALLPVSRAWGP